MQMQRELRIQGSDIDEEAISLARYHARQAGVENYIHFQKRPMADISSRYKYGFIICNPPYGERIGEKKEEDRLYREMGTVFSKLDTWSFYIITAHEGFERFFGRRADKKRKLYNGMMKTDFYQFYGPKPPKHESIEGEDQ
jgi:putative N6-adenine-specific DNA methylase